MNQELISQSPVSALQHFLQSSSIVTEELDFRTTSSVWRQSREVVFLASNLEEMATLLQGLRPNIDLIFLDSHQDGMIQITRTLKANTNVKAIHLVTHGSPGTLHLGSSQLNLETLSRYRPQLQQWGKALAAEADILLYGCHVAQTSLALPADSLLRSLHEITGANIAASSTPIGNAAQGGNWELDYHLGTIQTSLAVTEAATKTYSGILATITVTTTADVIDGGDGLTSLREAIIQANTNAGDDEIVLEAGTYTLSIAGTGEDAAATGDLDITDTTGSTTITGAGEDLTTIDADRIDRVLHVLNGDLSISDITVAGGYINANGDGGGIYVDYGNLVVNSSTITGNVVVGNNDGGAISNYGGSVEINNSTISGNSAGDVGGGIASYYGGQMVIRNSAISGNSAGTSGGGVSRDYDYGLVIVNSTISGNSAGDVGGGLHIDNSYGDIVLINSTITGNTATNSGGGIYLDYFYYRDIVLSNSTITGNTATGNGGGIYLGYFYGGAFTAVNSIVSGNTAGNLGGEIYNYEGNATTAGVNLLGDSSQTSAQAFSGFTPGANDIAATSDGATPTAITAILDTTLQDNGGPTLTHALAAGSPALDAGDNAQLDEATVGVDFNCDGDTADTLETDQRSANRVTNATVDIGAVEDNEAPMLTSEATASVPENTSSVLTVTADDPENDALIFALIGGVDVALFSIDPATGELSFSAAPDFENPADANGDNVYEVEVDVDDGNFGLDSQALTITVTDVDESISAESLNLQFSLTQFSATQEIGFFLVEDTAGTLNGLTPNDPGYINAALTQSFILFSALPEDADIISAFSATSTRSVTTGSFLSFFSISEGTVDGFLSGENGSVSFSSIQFVQSATASFSLEIADLILSATPVNTLPVGANSQGGSQGEVIDLTGVTGTITATFTVQREATFDNLVGFYVIDDLTGQVLDSQGNRVSPSATTDYIQAAVNQRIADISLSTVDESLVQVSATLNPGQIPTCAVEIWTKHVQVTQRELDFWEVGAVYM